MYYFVFTFWLLNTILSVVRLRLRAVLDSRFICAFLYRMCARTGAFRSSKIDFNTVTFLSPRVKINIIRTARYEVRPWHSTI